MVLDRNGLRVEIEGASTPFLELAIAEGCAPRHALVILLKDDQLRTWDEIAELLGIHQKTARRWYTEALDRLTTRFATNHLDRCAIESRDHGTAFPLRKAA